MELFEETFKEMYESLRYKASENNKGQVFNTGSGQAEKTIYTKKRVKEDTVKKNPGKAELIKGGSTPEEKEKIKQAKLERALSELDREDFKDAKKKERIKERVSKFQKRAPTEHIKKYQEIDLSDKPEKKEIKKETKSPEKKKTPVIKKEMSARNKAKLNTWAGLRDEGRISQAEFDDIKKDLESRNESAGEDFTSYMNRSVKNSILDSAGIGKEAKISTIDVGNMPKEEIEKFINEEKE